MGINHDIVILMRNLSRRSIVTGALTGAGIVAGGSFLPEAGKAASLEKGSIWSAEYTAKKGSVSLVMYRKRVGAPASGPSTLPVVFLVHGSSLSARTSYDLAVPEPSTAWEVCAWPIFAYRF